MSGFNGDNSKIFLAHFLKEIGYDENDIVSMSNKLIYNLAFISGYFGMSSYGGFFKMNSKYGIYSDSLMEDLPAVRQDLNYYLMYPTIYNEHVVAGFARIKKVLHNKSESEINQIAILIFLMDKTNKTIDYSITMMVRDLKQKTDDLLRVAKFIANNTTHGNVSKNASKATLQYEGYSSDNDGFKAEELYF